jgi:hypothetical protein
LLDAAEGMLDHLAPPLTDISGLIAQQKSFRLLF